MLQTTQRPLCVNSRDPQLAAEAKGREREAQGGQRRRRATRGADSSAPALGWSMAGRPSLTEMADASPMMAETSVVWGGVYFDFIARFGASCLMLCVGLLPLEHWENLTLTIFSQKGICRGLFCGILLRLGWEIDREGDASQWRGLPGRSTDAIG